MTIGVALRGDYAVDPFLSVLFGQRTLAVQIHLVHIIVHQRKKHSRKAFADFSSLSFGTAETVRLSLILYFPQPHKYG